GLIENPFLVEEVKASLTDISYSPPSLETRINVLLKHCSLMVEYYGEKKGILDFRKFIRGYLKGLPNISILRQKLNVIDNYNDFSELINQYYSLKKTQ
ncbi:MAG: tRNA-dihydrouridine synthase, partial [Spirochaetes bacterium]|nr:tRNA-dihydrouridine synthase [Spirochaetota bacterium]